MRIVKIEPFTNGGHDNQESGWMTAELVPDGWAIIPETLEVPETFPFVTLETEEKTYYKEKRTPDGTEREPYTAMTVTAMTAGAVPPAPTPEPTVEDDSAAMLVDYEYRLTLLELGLME